jgi:hypothetical protein
VVDRWNDDAAALRARTAVGLRSLAATRAALETNLSPTPKEPKMRLFKQHPALATLLVIAGLGLLSGAAYAIVDRVFLSIDPEMSAPEIEEDVQNQLDEAGVNATVEAEKTEGRIDVRITGDDPSLPENLDIAVGDEEVVVDRHEGRVQLEVKFEISAADQARLIRTVSSAAFTNLTMERPADQTDAEFVAAVKRVFADAGFHDTAVTVDGDTIFVTVNAPPR